MPSALTPLTAAVAVIGTAAALLLTAPAAAVGRDDEPPAVAVADTTATAQTLSLFRYLQEQQGQGALFGHQHTIDDGLTFSAPDGTSSDVLAGTGEYPAVFGWDTLILEGKEKPGLPTNTPEQNVEAFAAGMVRAHELGGVNTISAHMRNFVTGNDFTDPSGRVVSQILPGGPKNAEFTAYLDLVAATADATVDSEGTPIPILFRPFHENTGSWFWWGAAWTTPGEYKEVWRYTVEYLRDTKDVHNLLYAFSPNGSFGGDAERYLDTYPGDEFVDVLGYDAYDYDNAPETSAAYVESVRVDLAMITDLAAARGKVAAFTEFGRNGERTIKPSGNKSLTFYTDLLEAISADPKARRIAYMLTWSNWGPEQFYVPYPAYDAQPEHEMYRDFLAFYQDPFTVFSQGVGDPYGLPAQAEPAEPAVRVVSPADGVRVTGTSTTLRVRATVTEPDRVTVSADGGEPQELTLDGPWWTGTWQLPTDRAVATLTARAEYADGATLEATSTVLVGEPVELPPGVVDDFDAYPDDVVLRSAYSYNNAVAEDISLVDQGGGDNAVRFGYDFTSRSYGGFGKVFATPQDWSAFNQVEAWLDPDASGQKLVLQVNTANGQSFEAYPSLAGDEPVQLAIDVLDFRAKSDPDRPLRAADLAGVREFWVYLNQVGEPRSGSIQLDDVRAASGDAEPTLPLPPDEPGGELGLVDDFEGYADDVALRAAWTRSGAQGLSLSADVKASGDFGGAFPYTPAFDEFQKAVNQDWSGFDRLSMWVQPGASEQKLVLQLVASGFYYDAVVVAGGVDAFTAAVPWSEFTPAPFQGRDPALRPTPQELADVQQLVLFVEPTGSTTTDSGTVHLDDIRATAADVDPEPVDSRTIVRLRQSVVRSDRPATARVVVRSDGDATPSGTVTLHVRQHVVTATLDAAGRADVRLPALPPGVYRVRAEYAGDESTLASRSRPAALIVLAPHPRGQVRAV